MWVRLASCVASLAAVSGCSSDGPLAVAGLHDLSARPPTDGAVDGLLAADGSLDQPDLLPPAFACANMRGLQPNAPWPMEGYCPTHIGRSPYRGPSMPRLKWTYRAGSAVAFTPAIAADGTVVFADGGQVRAIDPVDGKWRWVSTYDGVIAGSVAIGADDKAYIGNLWFQLSGSGLGWRGPEAMHLLGPLLTGDGALFVGTGTTLQAIAPLGFKPRWAVAAYTLESSPALAPTGEVVFASTDGASPRVRAFDPLLGTVHWETPLRPINPGPVAIPAIGLDGTVFVGLRGGNFHALEGATGHVLWVVPGTTAPNTHPAIGGDGTVYVGFADEKEVVALDPATGKTRWAYAVGAAIECSPTLDAAGTLFIGTDDNRLLAIDGRTGTLRWAFPTRSAVRSAPSIAVDGTLYFGSDDGLVYAVGS